MEWVDGEALERFANRSGKLAPALVASIIEQIGGALSSAHSQNIIHRDLKPANIMYNPTTQRAVLLDFGIARDSDVKPEERLTRTGFFVGTLQYVAPEALSGELVNQQADVYSLATIAYYLLTGTLPYTGRSPRELFQQLLTQPPVPLNEAVKGLKFPGNVEQALMNGLERDLGKRSKTVDEFTAGLCTALRQPGERKSFLQNLFGK
jgi:serine/threonine protein kinase